MQKTMSDVSNEEVFQFSSIVYASTGKRFLAGLIDYTIIFTITSLYITTVGAPNDEGGQTVTGVAVLPINICWFLLIVCTEHFLGATLGNGIMGLSVQSMSSNKKPTFIQSLKRHLLDMIDMFPFGLIGFITINNTPQKQRLGDIWAKTIVVVTSSK
jgi:uncharacterized RDD family membrane protein YckC